MSTLKAANLVNPTSATTNLALDTSGNVTAGGNIAMVSSFLRNRIINGDMRIDQRNAGASVSISSASNTYFVDRWRANANGGGVFSVARSTVAPAGFTNSIVATVTTADASVVSGDFYHVRQSIEGFNFSDLGFGTSSAQTVTLSFWVRSSITGTYPVLLRNGAGDRGYVATYAVNSANTWEQKIITIAGDTTGTWPSDNTASAIVNFSLGCGNTQAVGSWVSSASEGAAGQVQWISTLGATFYITGVQLEVGTIATPFERRLYGQELALCQRYYYRATGANDTIFGLGQVASSTVAVIMVNFPTTMRTSPSALEQTGTAANYKLFQASTSAVACSSVPTFNAATTDRATSLFTASTLGGTAGQATGGLTNGTGYLGWSAEL